MDRHMESSKMPAVEIPAIATAVIEAGPAATARAAAVLAAGGLVAFPTETVYGLGADAANDRAVARIYAAKERPSFNPLIAHVADLDAARRLAQFSAQALILADTFWPGPLTLVLPRAPGCPVGRLATAGLDTIAVRMPSHSVAREILAAFGNAVMAPSANRSGRVSPTSAQHVATDLTGRVELIIDGGRAPVGVESTVLACRGGDVRLLRPGAIPRTAVEHLIGRVIAAPVDDDRAAIRPLAPGMLTSHYAPRAAVRMNVEAVTPGEALLAFGPALPPGANAACMVLNLSSSGDLIEAAANLFSHLRILDDAETSCIAVMRVPEAGLGEAINDRLRRAAAPRQGDALDSTGTGDSAMQCPGIVS
jgi:L-threonylcarbamoyladenylate synthase